MTISYEGLLIRLPEPGAFALHKLIVSQRRTREEKAKRDLEGAVGLLTLLFSKEQEKKRVLVILKELPPKWREKILSVSKKHFPSLNEAVR